MFTGMSVSVEFDPLGVLDQVTTSACEELFARYGVAAKRVGEEEEPTEPDFFMCAIIGFAGRDVWGTLILAVTEEISDSSNPVFGNGGKRVSLRRDWVGELANPLLGRVKHELLRHGVEIHTNLPAVLRGRHLAPLPRVELKPLKFALAGGAAAVWLEVEARPEFEIGRATPEHAGAAAGDALLFE